MGSIRVEASDGVSLNVAVDGDGDRTALLLHGFPDSHALWRKQVPVLVDAGYRVIAPDLRGFGESGKPRARRAYVMSQIVDDLGRILDAQHVDGTAVIGHDWGAVAGWAFAGHRPERTEKLVAVSVGHPRAFVSAWAKQFPRSWYAVAFQVPGLAEFASTVADHRLFKLLFGVSPDWPAYEARLGEPGALTAGFNWYRANANPISMSREERYPRVKAPTLGVRGTRDVLLTREQMEGSGEYVDAPWRYEELPGGHWLPLTRDTEFNPLLLDFLAT
jgi:pimeloyl-ACP methyl ester carboxylesterase